MARKRRMEDLEALYHALNREGRRRTPAEVGPEKSLGPQATFGGKDHGQSVEVGNHLFNSEGDADKFTSAGGELGPQPDVTGEEQPAFGPAAQMARAHAKPRFAIPINPALNPAKGTRGSELTAVRGLSRS